MSKHSLFIFEQLYTDLPPLVPEDLKKEMGADLVIWQGKNEFTLDEVEEVVIKYGKKTWPYRRAFYELVEKYRTKLGEIFFHQKASKPLEKRYEEFVAHGGNFEGLCKGQPAGFFTSEERVILTQAMVEIANDIKEHAKQAVLSVERDWYEKRIENLMVELEKMEEKLGSLKRTVAEIAPDHPDLADEMREHVRALEYGFSLLAPHTQAHQIDNANEYFLERHKEKELFKTLNV